MNFEEKQWQYSYSCILHISGKSEEEQAKPRHIILTRRVRGIPTPSPKFGFSSRTSHAGAP